MSEARKGKLSELTPDQHNANRGTKRGLAALDHSVRKHGVGRGILVDKHGNIIAGNKTVERLADLGIEDIVVVPTDGNTLVVTQRTDLDLETDKAARELAYADNRVSELDLDWDSGIIKEDEAAGVDLSPLFTDDEMDEIIFSKTDDEQEQEKAVLLDQAVQLQPAREYIVVMCDDPAEFDQLKHVLDLPQVRRGGYKTGSMFDAVGVQRVIFASDLLKRLNAGCDSEQG